MGYSWYIQQKNPPSNVGIPVLAFGGSRDNPGFGTVDFMPKEIGFFSDEKPAKTIETSRNQGFDMDYSTYFNIMLGFEQHIQRKNRVVRMIYLYQKVSNVSSLAQTMPNRAALCFFIFYSNRSGNSATVDRYEMVRASTSSTVVRIRWIFEFQRYSPPCEMLAHISNYLLV